MAALRTLLPMDAAGEWAWRGRSKVNVHRHSVIKYRALRVLSVATRYDCALFHPDLTYSSLSLLLGTCACIGAV